MIGTLAVDLTEAASHSFQGPQKRPPVKPPPEPERKSPPIGPPKRDPKPEPIHDPPMPDPEDEPLPIGDPPDTPDHPIRMRLTAGGFPVEWPMNYSRIRGGVASIHTCDSTICDPLQICERRSL